MSAQRERAATQNRVQNFQMEPGEPLVTALEEALSGGADHIGHLDGWPWLLLRTAAGIVDFRQRQRVESEPSAASASFKSACGKFGPDSS